VKRLKVLTLPLQMRIGGHMRSTSNNNIHFRFPWVFFLCFWLWTVTGLFFPQAALANDAPVAVDEAYSTDEDVVLNVAAPGVLSNDSDVDGDALSAVLTVGPSNGTLGLNADGSFSYTHDGSENIIDSFTYAAADTSLKSTAAPDVTVIDIPKESLADKDNPTYTVKGLDATQVYFFAVTAYDDEDPVHESDFSNGESTLRITEPEEGFFVDRSDYTHYKIKGKGVPETRVENFANNMSMGTVAVDVDGGWTKHVDLASVIEGKIELTVVYNGIPSFPVKGKFDITAPLIELTDPAPSVTDHKDIYAIIEWVTNEPAFGTVEYGLDENYGNIKTSEVLTTNHRIIITGLTADSEYHFQVSAEDEAGYGPDDSSEDNNPSPDYRFITDPPTPPAIVKYPAIGYHYFIITFDKPDIQNAALETSYTFSPSLIFHTPEDITDSIFKINDFSYILIMQSIPEYEILTLTVSDITDSARQPVTPATIKINDNDNDEVADDWETEYDLDLVNDDSNQDPDGDGYSNYQEYLARTHPRNDAPVATADAMTVAEGETVSVLDSGPSSVLVNDSDAQDDALTAVLVSRPSYAADFNLNADGTFSYTHDGSETSADSFTYQAQDTEPRAGEPVTVSITVTAVNDAPSISGTPATTVSEDSAYSFTPVAADDDTIHGDVLTFSVVNPPAWASFNTATGVLSGTPASADVGTTTGIEISVADSSLASVSLAAFDLEVVNINTDLNIQQTVDNLVPDVNDQVVFTITVTNNDPSEATGIKVIDILPSGLSYVSDDSAGNYDPRTGIWDIGSVSASPENNTANLNITATVFQEGAIVNIAGITDSQFIDLNRSDNSSGLLLNAGSQADLAIEKTVDNPVPIIGGTITFTTTLTNNGIEGATGVQVTDSLPPGLIYQSNLRSQGSFDPDTGVWDVGNLDVGAGATLQLTVEVDNTVEKISTTVITYRDQKDPDTTNNEATAVINQDTDNPPAIADLALQNIVNQSQVNVGDEAVFTVVVRNRGPDNASDVQIDDLMSDGLTLITSEPYPGAYNEETGIWDVGTIGAGSYATMDIVAEVTHAGLFSYTATIDNLSEFDPNNSNDSDTATVTGLAADLLVRKELVTADNPILTLRDSVVYEVSVTNLGPDVATDIVVTDRWPDGLTYLKVELTDGTYNTVTGAWDIDQLSIGAEASLVITAIIEKTGNITNTAVRTASSPTDIIEGNDTGNVILEVPDDGDDDGMPDEWEYASGLDLVGDDSEQDPDDDGLTNVQEHQNRTDPKNSDSDLDDMPDGWEVSYGLNPLIDDADADMDNDGYTNLQEYLYRTQPNDGSSKPRPPKASAGPDQTQDQSVDEVVTVTLDGSNSSDPNNDIVEYYWKQTGGEPVVLSTPNAVQPTFVAPQVVAGGASFTFQLTVTDHSGQQGTDTCIVNVTWDNDPPTADAGEDQTVDEGVTVILDGSRSSDPDDGIQSYRWTQTAGIRINLNDDTAAQPSFVSPTVDSNGIFLEFLLHAVDKNGLESTDTCIVNVTWFNAPPTAKAGPDQTVAEGGTVTLDGSESTDPDDGIEFYFWIQEGGTPVTLSDVRAVQPTFVTPLVDLNGTRLEFLLAVIDSGGLAHTDNVSIDVEDNGIDVFPDDVLSTLSATGENIAIEVVVEEGEERGGHLVSFTTISPESVTDIFDTENIPVNLIYGLMDMEIKVDEVGSEVRVTIHLNEPAPEGYSWFKYASNGGWKDYSDHAEFNPARDQVILTLVDGGIGDDDGEVNGLIVDPSGLGIAPPSISPDSSGSSSAGSESGGGGGGGCFISSAGEGSLLSLLGLLGLWSLLSLLGLLARFNPLRSSSSKN
jgi:uncharacterized repeat protein (TIGR01451 family)